MYCTCVNGYFPGYLSDQEGSLAEGNVWMCTYLDISQTRKDPWPRGNVWMCTYLDISQTRKDPWPRGMCECVHTWISLRQGRILGWGECVNTWISLWPGRILGWGECVNVYIPGYPSDQEGSLAEGNVWMCTYLDISPTRKDPWLRGMIQTWGVLQPGQHLLLTTCLDKHQHLLYVLVLTWISLRPGRILSWGEWYKHEGYFSLSSIFYWHLDVILCDSFYICAVDLEIKKICICQCKESDIEKLNIYKSDWVRE